MRVLVSDAQSKETLPGVVLVKKGTNTGATTDENGFAEIQTGETYTTHFTGYKDNTFVATSDEVFLNPADNVLGEVEIIGHKKSNLIWIIVLIIVIYYVSRK